MGEEWRTYLLGEGEPRSVPVLDATASTSGERRSGRPRLYDRRAAPSGTVPTGHIAHRVAGR